MRIVLLLLLLACPTPVIAQNVVIDTSNQSITPDMQTLAVHVGGRVRSQPLAGALPHGATSYSHQWPGVYFEVAFTGGILILKFNDPTNEYRLFIDDNPPITLAQPGQTEITVQNLPQGLHRARLEKVTESVWIIGAFDGFYVPQGATAPAPPPRTKQIEFIGDSDMTGYGIRSPSRTCTPDEVRLTSDTQSAYPALVAKYFDADYQINAISGRGMVRNYAGISPDHTVQFIYPTVLPDEPTPATRIPYGDANWSPQIIFISLGDNDFATPLMPGEAWTTNESLIADYLQAFNDLLSDLHMKHPDAALIIGWFNAGNLADPEKIRFGQKAQAFLSGTSQKLEYRSIDFIDMTNLAYDKTACDYHGSIADHKLRAGFVIDYIARNPGLWLQL